jgi:hypothetical protein
MRVTGVGGWLAVNSCSISGAGCGQPLQGKAESKKSNSTMSDQL